MKKRSTIIYGVAILALAAVMAMAYVGISGIVSLEHKLAVAKAETAELRNLYEESTGRPLAFFVLYRKMTEARLKVIEPRWGEIVEATWRCSLRWNVPAELTAAKMEHESFFNPAAVGSLSEMGLMQIFPPAHPQFDVRRGFEIEYNIDYGCRIFSRLLTETKGDLRESLRRYNGMGVLPPGMLPYADRVLGGMVMRGAKARGIK